MGNKLREIQAKVNETFEDAFSRTPLNQRTADILGEALELSRYTDFANLQEETGDLLASTIQLCNENGWKFEELVQKTLDKIQRRRLQYKGMGRKTRVCILGGAFNPITVGHIKLAQFILNTSREFDEIFLTPCAHHLYSKQLVSAEHRLAMCEMAAKVDGRIKVFNYEIENDLSGETYHFVKRLQDEGFAKNRYDFSYAIGLDNANTFSKWVNYDFLERMIRFVVVARAGIKRDPNVNWYLKPPHIFLEQEGEAIPEISSTQVRELLGRALYKLVHEPIDYDEEAMGKDHDKLALMVGQEVADYIWTNNLYMGGKK